VVTIIRLIKNGRTVLETDDLHHVHEQLIIRDREVKEIVVTVRKHK
jgi:hypothetical protein